MKNLRTIFLFLTAFLIISPTPTYAYLDPGAGSYLFQILAAIIFTSLFIFKSWWRRVRALLDKLIDRKGNQDEQTSEKDQKHKE